MKKPFVFCHGADLCSFAGEGGNRAGTSEQSKEPMISIGLCVIIVWLLVRSLPALKLFGALDCRPDGGFGNAAEGFGFVVLIAAELHLADSVGAGFD